MNDAPSTRVLQEILDAEVGQTPYKQVHSENKLRLLHYPPEETSPDRAPLLIVYSLINKPYILDLEPERSVIQTLLDAGWDVYLIDWGEPSYLDQHLSLRDYVRRYIYNCVQTVQSRSECKEINMMGYCMGGTLAAMYAALYPGDLQNLVLMASGLDFSGDAGILETWVDESEFEPGSIPDAFGNAPWELLQVSFEWMEPLQKPLSYRRLLNRIDDDSFLQTFARMEQWGLDGIDVAGATYHQFVSDLYQENQLIKNALQIGDDPVDLNEISMPVLQIIAEHDHIIPPSSSIPFNDAIASTDTDVVESPTGHIGLSVSGYAHEKLWPEVDSWLRERQG